MGLIRCDRGLSSKLNLDDESYDSTSSQIYKVGSSRQNLEKDEATFNDMFTYPFLKAVAKAVQDVKACGSEFRVGETPLNAMTKQLNGNDDSTLYYADGIITLYGMEELEVLLLEIIFVQAADKTIYIWSLRFVVEGPAYELWLEGRLDINPNFECKLEQPPKFVKFYWLLKCLLEDSVENISTLKDDHCQKLKEFRFTSFPSENLSTVVNPSILKLVEEDDKVGMHQLGPFYE
ncbi:uncharacterized protein EV154DRAFT_538429 [Mucor mucedo]|uniref:uncharacterized protein n=1 Tax=Mucor mucedo TaxID=29922 RepID=UPI002220ABAE|nr:uncharacterized protein EV154DRAFT_538429 [Mucor mucedo]KAI7890293.1 hypothetical protein EV154DRAFT_538429 [Mucor mucedo]